MNPAWSRSCQVAGKRARSRRDGHFGLLALFLESAGPETVLILLNHSFHCLDLLIIDSSNGVVVYLTVRPALLVHLQTVFCVVGDVRHRCD
jgi:hypothetical protein